jgi:parvulin-like peptidyl-prolyl isomerase
MSFAQAQEHFVTVLVAFTAILALLTITGLFPLEPVAQAAVVNGDVITASELEETYAQLPEQLQEQYSKQEVLSQLIEKELILSEAKRLGISVSEQEVEAYIDEQVASLGISQKLLRDTLKQGGISYEEYQQAVREELILRTFVEQEILSGVQANSTQEQQVAGAQAFQQRITELRSQATISVSAEYQ